MAGRNPFETAFDPSNGGLTGFLGGLAGVPSNNQSAGGATSDALAQLSQLKDSGLNNQQALLKFFQTPQGHDYFASAGPDGLKGLVDGLQATTAPTPTQNVLAPGAALASTDNAGNSKITASNPQQFPNQVLGPQDQQVDGKGNVLATNPNQKGDTPSDVRSFNFFAALNQTPPDELKRLAGLKLDPSSADKSTVASQTIDDMVKRGVLTQALGDSLKAGTISVLPVKNEFGQDTGSISVYDKANPSNGVQLIKPQAGSAAPAVPGAPITKPLPGTNTSTGAATGVLPATESEAASVTPGARASSIPTNNPNYFGTKASMFLASGPIATGLQGASAASEMINPKMIIPEGAQAADRQTMIDTLRSDLAAMGQIGGGIGVNKGVLEGYLKLAPTGGLTESPHQAIQKAIRLSEHVQQEIDAQSEVVSNDKLPIETRKQAQTLIQGWQRVQRDLPSPDELGTMEKSIREGTAGAPTISGAANTIVEAGSKALTEVKKEVTTTAKQQGLTSNQPDIDSITSPADLAAIDPRGLDRAGKIKYLRKVDQFTKRK